MAEGVDGKMSEVSATQIRVVKDMKKSKIVELKNIIKDYPMRKEELIEILTDLEEQGLITGVGRDKIKLCPIAEQLMKQAVYEQAERNKDVM